MGVDLIPRLKKHENYGLHYSGGGGDYVANLFMFAGAGGTVLEALDSNYGYIRKKDALELGVNLERLYNRLKQKDTRPLLYHKARLSKKELTVLVRKIAKDLGRPVLPAWLIAEMVTMMSDDDWDPHYDFPGLIKLCKKAEGFWWC